MDRRHLLVTLAAAPFGAIALAAFGSGDAATSSIQPVSSDSSTLVVFRTAACGCCGAWIDHMGDAGFSVDERVVDDEVIGDIKAARGIGPELGSCHTAEIGRYFVEGHVPATDVARLIAEAPDAAGIVIPGMPLGSPGMEVPGRSDRYTTLLVGRDGQISVFTRHG